MVDQTSAETYILLTIANAAGTSQSEWICGSGLHNLGLEQGDVVNADNGCNYRGHEHGEVLITTP